jgi:polar amino acid transport system substrate-binding protein
MNLFFRLAMIALAVMPCLAAASTITLTVLGQESIPPKWIAGERQPTGICPDILAAIEKIEPRLRFSQSPEIRSLAFLEQGLETGKIDAACALLDTERRRQVAQVVGPPLYVVRHRLAARSDDAIVIRSMAELLDLKPLINTQRNAGYANQLRALGLEVDDNSGDNTVNLKKVIAGHGRFFYINELTLSLLMEHEQFKGKVRMLDWVVKEEPIYFHISKKCQADVAPLVEQALNKLKESGELARIYANWARAR